MTDVSVGRPPALLSVLKADWKRASTAWNKDAGPIEKTVTAGEDLYFAAAFLIEELEEQLSKATETAATSDGRRGL